jgi:DNA-binding SARP family transcriptional activator/TolB-like protein
MLTLRLFGGLSLTDSGCAVPAQATQRRRLALLAVLATSDSSPTSKDKLTALLWPDANREHARHLLSDSLYVMREALGDHVFRIARDFVALDPAHLTSDVAEFRRALSAGDVRGAAEVHGARGAFLEGVHLVDSVEFEHWVDAERSRLSAELQRALDRLASDAARNGDLHSAVTWRRRLAAEDPLSSSAALALMGALAEAGDTPGAVAFARVHASLVSAELECPPDARVTRLADELRARLVASAASGHARPAVQEVTGAPAPVVRGLLGAMDGSAAVTVAPTSVHAAVSRRPPERLRLAVIAGLLSAAVLVFGSALWRADSGRSRRGSPALSVAVVPFTMVGGGSDDGALAAGATENLVHTLATSRGPRVITASLASRAATPAALRRIGESLHVTQVVEGDVRRSGDRVGVSVRLVDASTGYPRWTGSYVRETRDVLGLQEDIGRAVIAALRVPRSGDDGASRARQGTTNLDAYDLYLRGRHQEALRSDTGYRAAVQAYRAAIATDSGFAAAYAGLAESYAFTSVSNDYEHFPPRETAHKAEAAALRAIALDDSLAEAHFALGIVRMVGPIDFGESERELKRALALNPTDPRIRGFLAILYAWTERPEAAVREARALVDADPLSVTALRELGRALLLARRYDEALAQLERARTLGPPVRVAFQMEGEIYAVRGMYPQALAAFRMRRESLTRAMLAHTLARSGNTSAARRTLDDLAGLWRAGKGGAFEVAVVYAGLKDYGRTFKWLGRAIDDSSICGNIMDPMFDDVRADPRFAAVHRRLLGRSQ